MMRISKELMELLQLVAELKRRRIFNSLLITNTRIQIGYWDQRLHENVISDQYGARMHLRALDENDRREIEYIGKRLGKAR